MVSNPQQRGIHLYGVLLVRLTSHVWLTKWLLPYLKFVDEVESKDKVRFIENWGLQIYRDCIILFSNELSLHLNQYIYDYWSIKLFADILCDSLTTNKFQIVISKNPMLVIWIFFCTILNFTINILIYWERFILFLKSIHYT